MSKPRASYYARWGEVIVSATLSDGALGVDGLDELRVQVMRGFSEAMNYVDDAEPAAVVDPGTVDTTQLPPVD